MEEQDEPGGDTEDIHSGAVPWHGADPSAAASAAAAAGGFGSEPKGKKAKPSARTSQNLAQRRPCPARLPRPVPGRVRPLLPPNPGSTQEHERMDLGSRGISALIQDSQGASMRQQPLLPAG